MAETDRNARDLTQEKQVCFVIMPFGEPDGYEKGHFKKVYEQIFRPAIEDAGYIAHRADENSESTLIQAKIYEQLINAPMVLCDLSTKNPNVLYELGIRHAFDKPVVLVQQINQDHIFDIAGVTTIAYRKDRRYDEVIEDRQRITTALVETADTKTNYSFMNLVNLTAAKFENIKNFTQEDRVEVLLSELNRKVNKIEKMISNAPVDDRNITAAMSSDTTNLYRAMQNAVMYMKAKADEQADTGSKYANVGQRLYDAIFDYQHEQNCNSELIKLAMDMLEEINITERNA